MAKIIVTGGAGFIGSHIVDSLINSNHQVTVIDNLSSPTHENFYYNPAAEYHPLDIAEFESIRPLFDGVEYVFHLAAESRIQPTIENPLLAFRTNTIGTVNILQASREAGVKRVIYSSTSSSYGRKNTPPLVETMYEDCLNPYSVAKVAGEKACKMYYDLFGLETVIFRYFNVYGPREPVKGNYAPVVGLFLRQHIAGEPLTIVGDGEQRRDFTHVNDVVQANMLAMTTDHDQYGTVFNVGTGSNHSVLELAAFISNNIQFVPPRLGEARETLADNTKIKTVLGWKPKHSIETYIREQLSRF
jgi:UDP-glucose 4-epimerase